ncbi:hypothetical protein V2A60_010382 [Cordyceps javanica]
MSPDAKIVYVSLSPDLAVYEEVAISTAATHMFLVRVLAAKVQKMGRVESILRGVPVRPKRARLDMPVLGHGGIRKTQKRRQGPWYVP